MYLRAEVKVMLVCMLPFVRCALQTYQATYRLAVVLYVEKPCAFVYVWQCPTRFCDTSRVCFLFLVYTCSFFVGASVKWNVRSLGRTTKEGTFCWRQSEMAMRSTSDNKPALLYKKIETPCGISTRMRHFLYARRNKKF